MVIYKPNFMTNKALNTNINYVDSVTFILFLLVLQLLVSFGQWGDWLTRSLYVVPKSIQDNWSSWRRGRRRELRREWGGEERWEFRRLRCWGVACVSIQEKNTWFWLSRCRHSPIRPVAAIGAAHCALWTERWHADVLLSAMVETTGQSREPEVWQILKHRCLLPPPPASSYLLNAPPSSFHSPCHLPSNLIIQH